MTSRETTALRIVAESGVEFRLTTIDPEGLQYAVDDWISRSKSALKRNHMGYVIERIDWSEIEEGLVAGLLRRVTQAEQTEETLRQEIVIISYFRRPEFRNNLSTEGVVDWITEHIADGMAHEAIEREDRLHNGSLHRSHRDPIHEDFTGEFDTGSFGSIGRETTN